MERTPPAEPEDQKAEVANMEAAHLASAQDLEQAFAEDEGSMSGWRSRHRQCMDILVRQQCGEKRRDEHLKRLKDKLDEETARRIEAEAKVTRLLDIVEALGRGTRVEQLELELAKSAQKHDEQVRALVEEKNELKRRYRKLLTHGMRLDEENQRLKEKCNDQHKQLQEFLQETTSGSSREEDCAHSLPTASCEEFHLAPRAASLLEEATEESSVLSSEEAPNTTDHDDQEGSDSVPMPLNHLPEPVDPTLHTGVNLLSGFFLPVGDLACVTRSPDCRARFLSRVVLFAAEDCGPVGSKAQQLQSEKLRRGIVRRMQTAVMNCH
ncbi:unnamed protein product [Symbiodinium sp. CCMP2592]|nr:unnamed protein product [Symbiodinium sp. CCMP2592]